MHEQHDTIEPQRQALTRILATLVAMAGVGAKTLPRRLRNAVLRLLRPAESATRRLVIALAQNLVVVLPAPRKPKSLRKRRQFEPKMPPEPKAVNAPVRAALPLTDRARRRAGRRPPRRNSVPRISFGLERQPIPPRPTPFDLLDPARLSLRLNALGSALADLPKQALRFARFRARQERLRATGKGVGWRAPLRFGRPPGALRRPVHEVHEVLAEAHRLAMAALEKTDTS